MFKLPCMSITRQTLLERVRNPTDNDAWNDFFGLYEPLLTGYVRRYSTERGLRFSEFQIQEIVQDIFIKLYRALPNFQLDHQRGRFRTWLWRLTVNVLLDRIPTRKAFRRAQLEKESARPAVPRPKTHDEGTVDLQQIASPAALEDETWLTSYRAVILERALWKTRAMIEPSNPNKWNSFQWHGIEGRPAAAVAIELGINANLVYQNTARVLNTVRQICLEEYEENLAV